MKKSVNGVFTFLEGQPVYKIENYDAMENFFMTITSASDIWNFCWSYGGLTAGRVDSNHAIFPYYTADKVSDAASYTGPYTCVKAKKNGQTFIWEPFSSFNCSASVKAIQDKKLVRNIYKNYNGSRVWFEEINSELELLFRYSWTSSEKYGIVRTVHVENLGNDKVDLSILDGCRNILPACCTSDFQNSNSVLLDAYKKTDLDEECNLVEFSVSSIVSDKAEPNEGLYANTCWFSTADKISLDTEAPSKFVEDEAIDYSNVSKGKRSSVYINPKFQLDKKESKDWIQIFDTYLTLTKIKELKKSISDKKDTINDLLADIGKGNETLTNYIAQADGIQDTRNKMACLHHQQNVMFNIMRGGIFVDDGKIDLKDFILFISQRNKELSKIAKEYFSQVSNQELTYSELSELVEKTNIPQFKRLFLEYMPLTFSRRHGDPSRPWNSFNIKLKDNNGNSILNYEGNWRDIFQNWEALAYSYPMYIKNMCAKFLNAMTIEGFNPYKINRQGIDWEIPDPTNPWAQIGYWGDHQVIYFEKLLEFYDATNHKSLLSSLNEKLYTSSNVPYRLKSYEEIVKNPRSTIIFDWDLSKQLSASSKEKGSDAKLILDETGSPYLVSFTTKMLQIVVAKAANFIPGGGIWLNTQRPEWNDANNALAGYGLSIVTLCYLYRYINFLIKLYSETDLTSVSIQTTLANCLQKLYTLYANSEVEACAKSPSARKHFADKAGQIFEQERNTYYQCGYSEGEKEIETKEIVKILQTIQKHVEYTIKMNKRSDGLYHSYNTVKISDKEMIVEYLQEMLEGQVAVLSSTLLKPNEAIDVIDALRQSRMYETRQKSYMLYPNKELPAFHNKNNVPAQEVEKLNSILSRTGNFYLEKDINGIYHFNPSFRNANVLKDIAAEQDENLKLSDDELKKLLEVYEKTFNHQSFTGRSGTFYAYEGLGSIYWHMVSKLLLAVQENLFAAKALGDKDSAEKLTQAYYDVRSGLSYNKTPELYGAFPQDPYSHTPNGQGAKQPGMTGQVKEEVLTRWGELGLSIKDGSVTFDPVLLEANEIKEDSTLTFTWCGVKVEYLFGQGENTITVDGQKRIGNQLTAEEIKNIFDRNGKVKKIQLSFSL